MTAAVDLQNLVTQAQTAGTAGYAAQNQAYGGALAALQRPPSTQNAWLALSAGLLSPTRTGSFGEALSNGLKGYVSQNDTKAEESRALQIMQIELAKAKLKGDEAKNALEIALMQHGTIPKTMAEVAKLKAEAEDYQRGSGYARGQPPSLSSVVAAPDSPYGAPRPVPTRAIPGASVPAQAIPGGAPSLAATLPPPSPEATPNSFAQGGPVRGYSMGGMPDEGMGSDDFPGRPGAPTLDWSALQASSDAGGPGPRQAPAPAPSLMSSEPMAQWGGRALQAPQAPAPAPAPAGPQVVAADEIQQAIAVRRQAMQDPAAFRAHPGAALRLQQAEKLINEYQQERKANTDWQRNAELDRLRKERDANAAAAAELRDPVRTLFAKRDLEKLTGLEEAADKSAGAARAVDEVVAARKAMGDNVIFDPDTWLGRGAIAIGEKLGLDTGARAVNEAALPIRGAVTEALNKGAISDYEQRLIGQYTLSATSPESQVEASQKIAKAAAARLEAKRDMAQAWYKAHKSMDGFEQSWTRYTRENPISNPDATQVATPQMIQGSWDRYLDPRYTRGQAGQPQINRKALIDRGVDPALVEAYERSLNQ